MGSQKLITYSAMVIMFALIVSSIYTMPVEASEPEDISLVYDFDSQTLTVNVSHYVPNTKNHYIELIEIWKNDIFILNSTYTNQSFNWGMYDSFTVATDVGDNLTVTATCNLQGYTITSSLIVSSTTSTTTTTTTDTTTTTTTTDTTSTTTTDTTSTTTTTDDPGSPDDTANLGFVIVVVIGLTIFFILFFAWLKPEYVPDVFKQLGSRVRAGFYWCWVKLSGAISWLASGISSLFQQIKVKVSSK